MLGESELLRCVDGVERISVSVHAGILCQRSFDNLFFAVHDLHEIASPVKLKTKLPFLKPSICNNAYSSQNLQLGPGQICAGGNQGEDSCAGDSGSPLMHNDRKYDVWVLSGIVSRGAVFCGQEGKPGIYTNVEYYLDWISDVVIGGGNRIEELKN